MNLQKLSYSTGSSGLSVQSVVKDSFGKPITGLQDNHCWAPPVALLWWIPVGWYSHLEEGSVRACRADSGVGLKPFPVSGSGTANIPRSPCLIIPDSLLFQLLHLRSSSRSWLRFESIIFNLCTPTSPLSGRPAHPTTL